MSTISSIGVGKTYTTINLWDAAWATGGWIGELDNSGEMLVAGGATIGSHATSSTDNIVLRCATGKSFRDNASAATNALTYNASNGEALRAVNNYSAALTVQSQFVTLDGLQIQCNGVNTIGALFGTSIAIEVNNCILSAKVTIGGTDAISRTDKITARNSLFEYLTGGSVGQGLVQGVSEVKLYFCDVVVGTAVSTAVGRGIFSNYGNVTLENVALFGNITTLIQAGGSNTNTTCMTDKAAPPSGFTTVTYANQFVSNASPWDWRAVSTADLVGAGTADSTNGATDIIKTTRPQGGTWDIGAYEYPAASGITGSAAWTEAQDIWAGSGTVLVSGSAAWTEGPDIWAGTGTVVSLITGAAAWTEAPDVWAGSGAVLVSGSAAWTEGPDIWSGTGTITLPAITGAAAWTDLQDAWSAIGNNGNIDTHDPGLRKRRKKEEERRQKQFNDERLAGEARRARVADAFEPKFEEPEQVAEPVAAASEDFRARDEAIQRRWNNDIERDDEDILVLI